MFTIWVAFSPPFLFWKHDEMIFHVLKMRVVRFEVNLELIRSVFQTCSWEIVSILWEVSFCFLRRAENSFSKCSE